MRMFRITLIVRAPEWDVERLEEELATGCLHCWVTRCGPRNYRVVLDLMAASPEDARLLAEKIIKWTHGVLVVEVERVEPIVEVDSDVQYGLGQLQERPGMSL